MFTPEFHQLLIDLGVLDSKTPVVYAGTGYSEYAYNKYSETVKFVVEKEAEFDDEKGVIANYIGNTQKLYSSWSDVPLDEYSNIVLIVCPGFIIPIYDWNDIKAETIYIVTDDYEFIDEIVAAKEIGNVEVIDESRYIFKITL